MTRTESKFKTLLAAQVEALGGYARRWEDKYGVGRLDMLVAFHDLPPVVAEGKRIAGKVFGPTLRQYEEGLKAARGGLLPILIGWDKDYEMFVSEWKMTAAKEECERYLKGNYGAGLRQWLVQRQNIKEFNSAENMRRSLASLRRSAR